MPLFEFACDACDLKRFSELVGVLANSLPVQCPQCKSTQVRKLTSRFARLRSTDEALESLAERADGLDEGDPKALRSLMREVAGGLGEEITGDDVEELLETAGEEE